VFPGIFWIVISLLSNTCFVGHLTVLDGQEHGAALFRSWQCHTMVSSSGVSACRNKQLYILNQE
jgi:hypothetical protein